MIDVKVEEAAKHSGGGSKWSAVVILEENIQNKNKKKDSFW